MLVGLVCELFYVINANGDGCIPTEEECPSGYMLDDAH